ncbi:MAG: cell division protein FtsX [Bacteroidetes bacterium OLB12]|nr:MAG: cell division protein FtsX [Bacteroidetes bacterium OLB12]
MIRQEIILAFRDFHKNRLYWGVSVFSIALAVASVLAISHYVVVEKSYDKFHVNSEQIFRVVSEYKDGEQLHKKAMAPGAIGYYLKQNSPSINNFCVLSTKYGPEKISIDTTGFFYTNYLYATSSICKIFTFHFIQGSENGFEGSQTAIINETKARNWFGDPQKAIGQMIKMQQSDVTVVGIFKDFPSTSHFKPEFIVRIPDRWEVHNKWDWPSYYTYIKIGERPSALPEIESILDEANRTIFNPSIQKSNPSIHDAHLSLQALSDIHLNSNLEREIQANGSNEFITILIWIAILILVAATLNFTNLYVTQFQNRLKEVGLRKINGSSNWYIFQSYLIRALIVVLSSFAFALFFVLMLFPIFPLDILKTTPDSVLEFLIIPSFLLIVFLLPALVMYPIVWLRNTTTAQLIRGKAPLRISSSFFSIYAFTPVCNLWFFGWYYTCYV